LGRFDSSESIHPGRPLLRTPHLSDPELIDPLHSLLKECPVCGVCYDGASDRCTTGPGSR